MAGYIGSKSSVTQVDGYNRTEADAEFVNDPNSVITVSGSNVGIGTSSPATTLEISNATSNAAKLRIARSTTQTNYLELGTGGGSSTFTAQGIAGIHGDFAFFTKPSDASATERMRLDSSGNLLVGKTNSNGASVGVEARANGTIFATKASSNPAGFNRTTSDGAIVNFYKDGTTVGSIGTLTADPWMARANGCGIRFITAAYIPTNATGNNSDNVVDLGLSSIRFDDVYATNGTIQTSDRNEKQDIEVLSDAEQRVAVACKGLLRKFRWQDAVAEKGDDARIHFGIIAQDLQDAFAAEGLDAGRYAMFISSTWWETQTAVPAVEAVAEVLDDDGNVVTEAVEAKDAYTRTDTYETQAEAPEGATERTRLGVRYPELLAFIIGAM